MRVVLRAALATVFLLCIVSTEIAPVTGIRDRAAASSGSRTALAARSSTIAAGSDNSRRADVAPAPFRTPMPLRPPGAVKPKAGTAPHVPTTHNPGPTMLSAREISPLVSAARIRLAALLRAGQSVPQPKALPRSTSASARTTSSLDTGGAGTGINHWWRYHEENIPGGGHVMANLGTGNLLVQNDDMDIPHKGIDLAYRRTYNSQSRHDVSGGDGTPPGRYGNGWTSTFDAHVSEDPTGHTVSVWDIDGARYDYTLATDGATWIPPAGQHATLTDARTCGLLWTKKTGTTYYFYYPQGNPTCGAPQAQYGAYNGLVYQIIGRNTNTALTFYYEFTGNNAGPGGLVTNVTAGTESGLYANMQFADFAGHRLAQALSRPDGQVVWYDYDANGNLTSVTSPGNSDAGTTLVQAYAYTAAANGAPYMAWTTSPRWNASSATDGGYLYFGYQASGTSSTSLSAIGHVGFMNSVNDGLSSGPLQPGVTTGIDGFLTEYFTTTTTANGSAVAYSDSYNHVSNYVFDAAGRPLQSQECLTPASQQCPSQNFLISSETWDANNELIAEVDPRSSETDYAYDANGNTAAVAEPPPYANASRPTKLFAYDGYNNVTEYCDPVAAAGAGSSWNPPNAIPNTGAPEN